MDKTFIKIDGGKITAVVTSNDPTLIIGDGKNVVDITNHKNKDKIIKEGKYKV